jgi:sugar lactone lactonase YvrE/enterochelin esterase-like enzyme
MVVAGVALYVGLSSVMRAQPPASAAAQTAPAPPPDPQPGPDSKPQPGVPTGTVTKGVFDKSAIYPGTTREYWVYVPQQLDRSKPAPVMVFQDGLQYQAPVVFDNLIHRKELPPMVGVFVMHGRVLAPSSDALDRMNRSYEYDSVSDTYARFLLDEMLPFVETTHNLTLSKDGNDRAIAGNSSGAIAAFSAAWHRPDAFRRVFSAIGTYVGLRGGDQLPTLIRKTEAKPIRVFLEDGRRDLNNYTGDWWMANQDMLSALEYAGYDVAYKWGDGEHNSRHATAIFPDVVRWLWKGWPAPIKANPEGKSRQDTNQILIPGEDWTLVSEGHRFTEGPAVNERGELFFTDVPASRIHRVGLDGKVTLFAENTGGTAGLMVGPDGRMYGTAGANKQIVAFDDKGAMAVVADNVTSNDLVVSSKGDIYFTDPANRQVMHIPKGGAPRVVDKGIERPNGITLSPDQTLLYVADSFGQMSYAFQIQADGSLAHKQPYFYVHIPPGQSRSASDGMKADVEGRVYIATALGLQVFDQIGKCHMILPPPHRAALANVAFGGPGLDELYITNGDKVFKRKVKVKGVLPWKAPIKPAPPRL